MDVRWLTASLDRPRATFHTAVAFWRLLTGSALSSAPGERDDVATLLPPDGDAYLRVQRIETEAGGSHLDLHVGDVAVAVAVAVDSGATASPGPGGSSRFRSPAGLVVRVSGHGGEHVRPQPRTLAGSRGLFLVDQVCLDIPNDRYDEECAFWERVTGWPLLRTPATSEFRRLDVPPALPLRLLLQRRGDDRGPTRCHVDIAAEKRDELAVLLEDAGARRVASFEGWITMIDPAGVELCLTGRDPRTGASMRSRWMS